MYFLCLCTCACLIQCIFFFPTFLHVFFPTFLHVFFLPFCLSFFLPFCLSFFLPFCLSFSYLSACLFVSFFLLSVPSFLSLTLYFCCDSLCFLIHCLSFSLPLYLCCDSLCFLIHCLSFSLPVWACYYNWLSSYHELNWVNWVNWGATKHYIQCKLLTCDAPYCCTKHQQKNWFNLNIWQEFKRQQT